MLANNGIFAISPELGTNNKETNTFFIKETEVLIDTLEQNYKWVILIIYQLAPNLEMTHQVPIET